MKFVQKVNSQILEWRPNHCLSISPLNLQISCVKVALRFMQWTPQRICFVLLDFQRFLRRMSGTCKKMESTFSPEIQPVSFHLLLAETTLPEMVSLLLALTPTGSEFRLFLCKIFSIYSSVVLACASNKQLA